jgi:hypothetical protein
LRVKRDLRNVKEPFDLREDVILKDENLSANCLHLRESIVDIESEGGLSNRGGYTFLFQLERGVSKNRESQARPLSQFRSKVGGPNPQMGVT